ncbi:tetratricopeptide repeat protein [Rhodoferax sp. 4810]|uniref:protein O-GlcNAc transferase n=1 Tax=Thiospirillum jenense TaxID=1653858 RepID=A0A839HCY1_9GAMM|nr:tetratricopeptide repeat protein [Thiospirillum jenense]MBB1073512.1 tetratricopeptide repeat protein [Rhodoferax jenense]MBB1126000.1 tetratricopeptide repeat protein [Thiospirillum jenense]
MNILPKALLIPDPFCNAVLDQSILAPLLAEQFEIVTLSLEIFEHFLPSKPNEHAAWAAAIINHWQQQNTIAPQLIIAEGFSSLIALQLTTAHRDFSLPPLVLLDPPLAPAKLWPLRRLVGNYSKENCWRQLAYTWLGYHDNVEDNTAEPLYYADLANYPAPILLLTGDLPLWPLRMTRTSPCYLDQSDCYFLAGMPQVQLEHMANCDHWVMRSAPTAACQVLLKWWQIFITNTPVLLPEPSCSSPDSSIPVLDNPDSMIVSAVIEAPALYKEDSDPIIPELSHSDVKKSHVLPPHVKQKQKKKDKQTPLKTEINKITALIDAKKFSEAVTAAEEFVKQRPLDPNGWAVLANSYEKAGDRTQAIAAAKKVVEYRPNEAAGHSDLGILLQRAGHFDDALSAFQRAIELNPDYAIAQSNLGVLHGTLGHHADAEKHFRIALKLVPNAIELYNNLGYLYRDIGRLEEAADVFEQALKWHANVPQFYSNLLETLIASGQHNRAETTIKKLLNNPQLSIGILLSIAYWLNHIKCFDEAEATYQRALILEPENATLLSSYASFLGRSGRVEEAANYLRQALQYDPNCAIAQSLLLFFGAYTGFISPEDIYSEAPQWENKVLSASVRIAAREHVFYRQGRQHRPLRIGILSAEFSKHVVAYFLRNWLKELDRHRFTLFLYSTQRDSEFTKDFKVLADYWVPLAGLTNEAMAKRIREDEIDVLIETSGHTANNQLPIIARRAAPIQCHYIGWFATTGLTEMDYFIGDAVLLPPALDAQFTEQIWRLNRAWIAYEPLEAAPVPQWQPAVDSAVWFGSFNQLAKLTEATLALWVKVLQRLPQARLLLKTALGNQQTHQERITSIFTAQGITAERIVFIPTVADWAEHMSKYDMIDVVLDPITINSGTTAFDALWMGAPLITLAGNWMGGRMAASILTGLGHPEWIAQTEEEYIEKSVALAENVALRQQLRPIQREKMRHSQLCDAKGLAEELGQAFEGMFDRWYAKQ